MEVYGAKQESLTAHDRALQEAGSKLITESVETTRSFCKSLITISLSAIPVYFALLAFNRAEDVVFPWYYILPPLLYFVASLVSMFGYLPIRQSINIDNLTEVETRWGALVKRRTRNAYWGISLFTTATVIAILFVFFK